MVDSDDEETYNLKSMTTLSDYTQQQDMENER